MRYLFYLSLTILTATNVAAQSTTYCDYTLHYGDTTICQDFTEKKHRLYKEEFYVKDERIFTRWWRYRKNGDYQWQQKKKKGAFAKAEGPATVYYANGKVKMTAYFSHGKQVGDCLNYYPSGALKLRCYHGANGKLNGIRTFYYENGQVKAKFRWENGRLREILEYKDEQGQDIAVASFQHGTGDWIWSEKGEPTYRYFYKDGRYKKKRKIEPGNNSQ